MCDGTIYSSNAQFPATAIARQNNLFTSKKKMYNTFTVISTVLFLYSAPVAPQSM